MFQKYKDSGKLSSLFNKIAGMQHQINTRDSRIIKLKNELNAKKRNIEEKDINIWNINKHYKNLNDQYNNLKEKFDKLDNILWEKTKSHLDNMFNNFKDVFENIRVLKNEVKNSNENIEKLKNAEIQTAEIETVLDVISENKNNKNYNKEEIDEMLTKLTNFQIDIYNKEWEIARKDIELNHKNTHIAEMGN